jgi:putative tricarboxylic transport membrane protein
MRRVKVYCSLFWLLFAVVTCLEASRLDMGEMSAPGPGFFPLSLGVATGILSLIAIYQASQSKKSSGVTAPKERIRWWNILIIIGAVIVYTLSVGKLGFLINTFLLITLLLKVVDPQSWKTSILGGLITAIASELVFNVILKAQIPTGLLGF